MKIILALALSLASFQALACELANNRSGGTTYPSVASNYDSVLPTAAAYSTPVRAKAADGKKH